MLVFRVTMSVFPEKRLEMLQTLLSIIEPTEKRAGCLSYSVFCDIEDENRFSLLGEWETREGLNLYIASHQFSILLGTKALLCDPLEIQILTVSHSEGMAAIHAVRNNKNDH